MHKEWAELQLRQQSLPPSREDPTLLLGKPEFKASLWASVAAGGRHWKCLPRYRSLVPAAVTRLSSCLADPVPTRVGPSWPALCSPSRDAHPILYQEGAVHMVSTRSARLPQQNGKFAGLEEEYCGGPRPRGT